MTNPYVTVSLVCGWLTYYMTQSPDVVGSVESGIRAAAWSPDDAFLILVNGNDEIIQMTRDFDVLHEAPLHTTEFGEGQPLPCTITPYHISPPTTQKNRRPLAGDQNLHNSMGRSENQQQQPPLCLH